MIFCPFRVGLGWVSYGVDYGCMACFFSFLGDLGCSEQDRGLGSDLGYRYVPVFS